MVTMRHVGMVSCFLIVTGLVMLGGLPVMVSCVPKVLRS